MIYSNPLLTGAAWLMALALILLAGSVAYTTFYAEPDVVQSWAEYEACAHTHGVDLLTQTDPQDPEQSALHTDLIREVAEICEPFRPIPNPLLES